MKIVPIILASLVMPELNAQTKKISIEPIEPNTWQKDELRLIELAAQGVVERMGSTLTSKCTYRNSWRGRPSNEDWGRFMGVFRRQKELKITVSKQKMEGKYLAKAPVGRGKIDARNDRWVNLTIYLNEERIKGKANASKRTIDFWSATIAHELAHNMGLSHGRKKGADWETNYAGYFVTELGYCIMSNGRYGSDMGDLSLRRRRAKTFKLDWW